MATKPWNQASGLRRTWLAARVSPGVERIHGTASVLLVSSVRCFLSRLGANLTSHVDRKTRRLNTWSDLLLSPSVLLVQTNVPITILPSRPSPRLKSADCSSSNLPLEKVLDEGWANQRATAGTNYGYKNVIPGSNCSERKQIYLCHFNAQEKSERVSKHVWRCKYIN